MKKLWGVIWIVFGLIFFSQTTTINAARSFKIEHYHITANIQKNGDIDVTQRLNYQFDGDFQGVYYNQSLNKVADVTKPQVMVDTGYSINHLKESNSGKNETFKLTKTKKNMGIKVYHSTESGNETFIYKYRLRGLITNYLDTAELNWRPIDNWDNPLQDVKITINLPQENVPQLQAWVHGPLDGSTKVDRKDGRVTATVSELQANKFVETHLLFPITIVAANPNKINKNNKYNIQKQERAYAQEANASRQKSIWIYRILIVLGLAIIVLIYLIKFIKLHNDPVDKHDIPTPLYHSFDVPKFLPSLTKVILDKATKADSQALTANLMDEVGKRHMKIEKVGKNYEIEALVPPTNKFFKYLIEEVGNGKKVTLKQIRTAAREKTDDESQLEKNFDAWAEDAAKGSDKYLDSHNISILDSFRSAAIASDIIIFILMIIEMLFARFTVYTGLSLFSLAIIVWVIYWIMNKKITSYTEQGEIEVNQIRAFKRMLTDIDDIKLAEVGDIVLWEQFIPYAVAFGISDNVIRALKVNFSADEIKQSAVLPYYFGMSGFFASTSSGFQSSFVGALGAGGSSSISGGSGGFSGGSSGGFGGGSGGAF